MAAARPRPEPSADLAAASWVGDRMDLASSDVVGGMVPTGFDAYARVLHPASSDDRPLTWAAVAARMGRTLTDDMWFQDLADSADEVGYGFEAPRPGEIPDDLLGVLMPTLQAHTSSCRGRFCLWEGWGSVNGAMSRVLLRPEGTPSDGRATHFRARPVLDAAARSAFRLPWRPDHLLFEGPLDAIGEVGVELIWDPVDGDGIRDRPTTEFHAQTPSLFWPEDRAWCAANDIEASFTWIGGSAQLIGALHANPALEVAMLG